MAVPIRLMVSLLCLCLLSLVLSFNLEPRIPIVKNGTPGSHFGYTVAQHQTILNTASGSEYNKSWILVGAPKDHNLQPGTNRSGALWKCPLTTNISDCQQVHTDGYKNPETGLYNFDYLDESLSQPTENEIKDGQWLGVTLKSQGPGGKVLVCAHRYMHKGKGFQWGFGLCYILTQSLDVNDFLEPCRGKPVNEGHQQYGFCQAGTSGVLLDDEVVLGVPGPYTWRGTVHTSNISDDFLLKDKTQYFGPVTENNSPVDKYSYLGYSVTAGRFFGNYMSYVGGAPRSNGTGQVVFFSREKIGNSLLRVDLILNGDMFASSFGFEVLAIDINGDRRDDLVVGAPFYHSNTASGAVYIFMNNDGGFTPNHPYTKIEGFAGETRFGFSMTSLGDLNRDGYMDVAIGAPYEGRGAIYIYLGSDNGLIKEPAQVILSEEMPGKSYNAFGYALSGGMDLDGNGYPDLLTSSFCSDRVLLIRARPIIDIQTQIRSNGQLQNIDPSKKGCIDDFASPETCFSFDACFKMDNDAGTKTGLRLKYTIEERVYKDRPIPRVRFTGGLEDQPNIQQRFINLRPDDMGIYQCSREIVYLLDGPQDILRPLKFKLSYVIIQKEPRPVAEGDPVPDIDDYPILNQQEALRYFEGTFAKDCGDDDICESDLNVTGSLDLEQHESEDHYLLRLGEQDTVSLNVEVTNTGEPAYESTLLITHHKALAFNLRESEIGAYQCSITSPTVVQCGIGNPLTDTTGPLILSFRESGHPFDSKFFHFTVAANSSSREETPQDPLHFLVEIVKRAEISITGSVTPEQAFYGGEVIGESAIKHVEEVGKEVTHKYVIENRGPWRVNELEVEVMWPYQVENNKEKGKWLLYMTEQPSVDGIGECELDSRLINPLILRRQQIPSTDTRTAVEGEGELETPDLPGPSGEVPDGTEDKGEVGTGASGGSIKVTKTTTKKVTNTTTIKKKTSKTTSEKELSVSTERTSSSSGFSSGSSSSSSFSSSSSSSSSGFSQSNSDPSVDQQEGSGFNKEGVREHGRLHTRVSRTAHSSSDGSRFVDSNIRINNVDKDGDDDGTVVSHHEETRTSFGTSPDKKTKFHEAHHKSRKVTVKEETTEEEIPRGRWSDGGGYKRTYTETSSSGVRTSDSVPEDDQFQWENHRTSHSGDGVLYDTELGGDTDESESSSVGYDRREQDRRFQISGHSSGSFNRGETIRTHSESYGGIGGDDHDRRIYNEETKTDDGDSRTQITGYDTTHDREGSKRVHVYGGRTGTGIDRSGWPDESDRREDWRGEGSTRRVENVNSAQTPRRTGEDDFRHADVNDRVSSGVQRTYTDAHGRTFKGHGSSSTVVDYGQNVDGDSFTTDSSDYDSISRVHSGESDRKTFDNEGRTSISRVHSGGSDRVTADNEGRTSISRVHSGGSDRVTADHEGRTHHGDDGSRRTVFDWSDRGVGTGSHTGHSRGHKTTEVIRTTGSSGYRTDQDRNVHHSYDGHERTTGVGGERRTGTDDFSTDGEINYRSQSNGFSRSRDNNFGAGSDRFGNRMDSRTDSSNLRTSTWELSSGTGQNKAEWNTHSTRHQGNFDHVDNSQGHINSTSSSTARRMNPYDSLVPDENGTYTRVEVDPETGKTTVYTRRVYSGSWPENWDRRSYREEGSASSPQNEEEHIRQRRELKRIKREKELIIKPQAVTDSQTGKTMQVVNLRCDGDVPTAKCFVFRCNIRNLGARQSASIRIKSRLWNSTLVEDYPRVSYVSIKSKASLILPDDIREDQDQSDDVDSAETLAYPDLLDQLPPEEVPLWVILVSIFAGLLVLIIIVLILWKLGFFERKRPDPTLSGNLDKDANGY